jgi:hypothetical protein
MEKGEPRVWGLPTPLKLRPGAIQWFEELRNEQLTDTRSGGPAFWLDPERMAGVERVRQCRPTALIFLERRDLERRDLERRDAPEFRLTSLLSSDARNRLNRELMAESSEADQKRSETIDKIAELPCWLLHYSGPPRLIAQKIAQQIERHLADFG